MTKPMYCPMSFGLKFPTYGHDHIGNRDYSIGHECTPDCAWAVKDSTHYGCVIAAERTGWNASMNARPLKDDAE